MKNVIMIILLWAVWGSLLCVGFLITNGVEDVNKTQPVSETDTVYIPVIDTIYIEKQSIEGWMMHEPHNRKELEYE